jgi:Uma2 family endonuclease
MARAQKMKHVAHGGYTFGDYCTWPDEIRCEIIDGEVFDMTPCPHPEHQEILMNLSGLIWTFLKGKPCKVYPAPFDVRLPVSEEADEKIRTVVQPDISVICEKNKIDSRGCRGGPDFVIEILSPSTASKDHIRKKRLYEQHGVREYWLVDPVHHLITVYILTPEGVFGPATLFSPPSTITVSLFPEFVIPLDEVFPASPNLVREPLPPFLTKSRSPQKSPPKKLKNPPEKKFRQKMAG